MGMAFHRKVQVLLQQPGYGCKLSMTIQWTLRLQRISAMLYYCQYDATGPSCLVYSAVIVLRLLQSSLSTISEGR